MRLEIILVILLLILLFGCTEMTQSEKNYCYSLSTRSYDYVPTCTTEESCYAKIDSLFNTNLGQTQETKLYELKNNVARSWFYYNKTIVEIKKLSTKCKNGDISGIRNSINQMNFYLDKAFIELDQAMLKSFDTISFQEEKLTRSDVNLVKEEEIYYSLIQIKQILTELESGKTNSDSYVSYYLTQVNAFNSKNPTDYKPIIENQPFWLSVYYQFDKQILEKTGMGRNGYFPMLSDYLKKAISFIEFRFYKEESLKALQSFPITDIMLLYSKLGGNENSAFSQFVTLINQISNNYTKLEKTKNDLSTEVETLSKKAQTYYLQLTQDPQKIFIRSKLLPSKIISKENYKDQLLNLNNSFIKLKQSISKNDISVGKNISELKNLRSGFNSFITSVETNVFSENENLGLACDSYASNLENQLKREENLENYWLELTYLIKKTKSNESQLSYCEKLIKLNEEYQLALSDYETLKFKKMDQTKDCFNYLERIFEQESFYELENLFNELKKTIVTEENIIFFKDSCESIKKQIENDLLTDPTISQIINAIEKLDFLFEEIDLVSIYFDKPFINEINEKKIIFEKIKNEIYPSNSLDFSKLVGIKKRVIVEIEKLSQTTNELYLNEIIKYIETHIKTISVNNFIPTAGTNETITTKIIIENPFHKIPNLTKLKMNAGGKIISKSKEIVGIDENSIIFSEIPLGQFYVEVSQENYIAIESKMIPILVTTNNSIFQKIVSLKTNISYSKLIVKIDKPENTTKTILYKSSEELQFEDVNKQIITITSYSPGDKLTYYFYRSNIFTLSEKLLTSYSTISENVQKHEISITNTTDQKLVGTVILPLKINSAVIGITLVDTELTKLKYSQINDEIVIKNEDFLPKQTKTYYLTLKITSSLEYYKLELEKLLVELEKYYELQISEEIQTFLGLVPGKTFVEDAKKLIQRGQDKLDFLKEEKISQIELTQAKDKLKEKMNELTDLIENASNYNLENIVEFEELLNQATLALKTEDIKQILSILTTINSATYSISEEVTKKINEMDDNIHSYDLENGIMLDLYNKFIQTKTNLEEIISTDPKEGNSIYDQLKQIYLEAQTLNSELNSKKEEELFTQKEKIKTTTTKILNQLEFIENELDFEESVLIKAKFIPPITKTRIEKIKLILSTLSDLSIDEQSELLTKLFNETKSAVDYIKSKAIGEYNQNLDIKPVSQIQKAKTLIDNNKFVSAYLLLQEDLGKTSTPPYFIIPIILIVAIALVLRIQLNKNKKKDCSEKNKIESEWD